LHPVGVRRERALLPLPQIGARLENRVADLAPQFGERVEKLRGERAAAGPELHDVARAERGELGIERERNSAAEGTAELRCRDEIPGCSELGTAGAVVTEPRRIERELHVAREVEPAAGALDLGTNSRDERDALLESFVARDGERSCAHRRGIMGGSIV
jgi:hypothetical protein